MNMRVPFAVLVVVSADAYVATPLLGGPVIRVSVEPPDGPPASAAEAASSGQRPPEHILWGLVRTTIELARGEQDITGGAAPAPLIITAPDELKGPGPVRLYLCINHDALDSYVPSMGDVFQVLPVVPGNDQIALTAARSAWQRRAPSSPDNLLVVHYHRFDGEYRDASLWTWDASGARTPPDNELLPVGRDGFGLVFQIDAGLYDTSSAPIGLLPRRCADWSLKDGGDRIWRRSSSRNIYLLQDSEKLFSEPPDLRPQLVAARWDGEREISVQFNRPVALADWPAAQFELLPPAGQPLRPAKIDARPATSTRSPVLVLSTRQPLDIRNGDWSARAEGAGQVRVTPGRILLDPARFGDPDARLGAEYSAEQTSFGVFAPTAASVSVIVADSPDGAGREYPLQAKCKGLWSGAVQGNLAGKYYAYCLAGHSGDGRAELTDLYATCAQGRHARSLIVDPRRTDPPGFREHVPPPVVATDAIIYEMHVRDFTIAANSGVRQKGRYLGLCESGTTLPGDPAIKTGLDHLVELGVTHVQLMPVPDFDNSEENPSYNWGYMPVRFNSPEGWYASNVAGDARVRELKSAIDALHQRGLRVILDVVYNHTANAANFERFAPGYYYRLTEGGQLSNASGCGNEFNTAAPMARKMIIDSLRHWVTEYQVDGFRFDLMALIDRETLLMARDELRTCRPGILLLGEPWVVGTTPLSPITDRPRIRGTGLAAFNDHIRDAIRGDPDGTEVGFIQAGQRARGIAQGLAGAVEDWAQDPGDSINYFEAHDNLTSWDKLLKTSASLPEAERARMLRLGALVLLTAQGTPFLHSGQEFCRTKGGRPNSYNAPDSVNQLDWSLKKTHADVYQYYRGMIALRKAHPVLRLRTRAEVLERVRFPKPPSAGCVVCTLNGSGLPDEPAERLLVLLNGEAAGHEFKLPQGRWRIHADADRAGLERVGEVERSTVVPPHSGLLLVQ